ncbi:hypothetical protein TNCV_847861 [Trichonephila clavipes]|uniref:Uncharacterized protein n=1 Tax=Trichonephila clavipes TaxID=2585209 RepID=A0A8X6RIF8_TRICX|nr:hypothetical protein TNCV_847861 [Trichonephila clavipes]
MVYDYKPQTLDHLEDNIRRVIADIRPQMLEKVIENWTTSEPAVAVLCQKSYLKYPTPTRAASGAAQPLFDPPRNLATRPEDEGKDALNLHASGDQRLLLSQNSGL